MAVGQNQTSTLVTQTNCSYALNGDEGCIVVDPSIASYGAPFASAGGGAFVTEVASTGVRYDYLFVSVVLDQLMLCVNQHVVLPGQFVYANERIILPSAELTF